MREVRFNLRSAWMQLNPIFPYVLAFIDPFFSSGIHLALTGGLSAACTIAASIRGTCPEEDAINYHNLKIGTAYTRSATSRNDMLDHR